MPRPKVRRYGLDELEELRRDVLAECLRRVEELAGPGYWTAEREAMLRGHIGFDDTGAGDPGGRWSIAIVLDQPDMLWWQGREAEPRELAIVSILLGSWPTERVERLAHDNRARGGVRVSDVITNAETSALRARRYKLE